MTVKLHNSWVGSSRPPTWSGCGWFQRESDSEWQPRESHSWAARPPQTDGVMYKSSEQSSLISGSGLNSSPPEAKNPGVFAWSSNNLSLPVFMIFRIYILQTNRWICLILLKYISSKKVTFFNFFF